MTYHIKGWVKNSFCDWEGKVASVIFLPGCNFRCPFCQNRQLVTGWEELPDFDWGAVKKYLLSNADFLDGVVVTGGEPFMSGGLEEFIREIKESGLKIKIDTNGSFPEKIEEFLSKRILDGIAMDVKNELKRDVYQKTIGMKMDEKDFERVKKSIEIIRNSGIDYEFRTTVVPEFHTIQELLEIAGYLKGAKNFTLQGYRAAGVHPDFNCRKPYTKQELEIFRNEISGFFRRCSLRYYENDGKLS